MNEVVDFRPSKTDEQFAEELRAQLLALTDRMNEARGRKLAVSFNIAGDGTAPYTLQNVRVTKEL